MLFDLMSQQTRSIVLLSVSVLFGLLAFPQLERRVLLNLGFLRLTQAVATYSERDVFEIAQIGVPTIEGGDRPSAQGVRLINEGERFFKQLLQSAPNPAPAVRGLLTTSAWLGAPAAEDWLVLGEQYDLHWQLAAVQLNPHPQLALNHLYSICSQNRHCDHMVTRLDKAGHYPLAIEFLRLLLTRPDITPTMLETFSAQALDIMPHPGLVHADIVRNCVVFFVERARYTTIASTQSSLADIHSLCAEGLLVDPDAADSKDIGPALAHAHEALTIGGATRYRLTIAGWAELHEGHSEAATVLLRQALTHADSHYQRGRSDAEMIILINDLLQKAEAGRGP